MKTASGKDTRIKNKLSVVILGLFVLVTFSGIDLAGPLDSYGLDLYLADNYATYFDIVSYPDLYFGVIRKVAIYTDDGTNAESILAVFRAVAAMGHKVYGYREKQH